MVTFIAATATYTNAVLVAILPYISDYCDRLHLPVHTPITTNQVKHFSCDSRKGEVGGSVILTNDCVFAFVDGVVSSYADQVHSWKMAEGFGRASQFLGKPLITTTDAIALARESIKALGYSESDFFAEADPKVVLPTRNDDGLIPFYTVWWADPEGSADWNDNTYENSARIEIDGRNKRITSVHLETRTIKRKCPKLSVEPEALKTGSVPADLASTPFANLARALPSPTFLTSEQTNRLFAIMLPMVSKYARGVGLIAGANLTKASISRFEVDDYPANICMTLTNGARFVMSHGYISYYRGLHPFFHGYLDQPVSNYWGEWKLSRAQAIALARKTLEDLGCQPEWLHYNDEPMVREPFKIGSHFIPRYDFIWKWNRWDGDILKDSSFTSVEIDASTGTVKSVGVENRHLARPMPMP